MIALLRRQQNSFNTESTFLRLAQLARAPLLLYIMGRRRGDVDFCAIDCQARNTICSIMDLTDTQIKILLHEYAEAGAICRHHEDLTRKSLHFFIIVAVAIAGATQYNVLSRPPINFVIEMAGFLFGAFLINTILRLRRYYSSYISRAKAIEAALQDGKFKGMRLYTKGRQDFEKSRERKVTFSNKLAIVTLILVPTIYFLAMSIVHAYEWGGCLFIIVVLLVPLAALLIVWLFERVFDG